MAYRGWSRGLLAFLLIGLLGCVASEPRNTVNVISDKFSKSVTLEGIPHLNPNNGDLFWMLRSEVDPQGHFALHQIYVEWTYAGPSSGRYFAADDTARPLPVRNIRRESCRFNKCDRTDTLGIGIDEATLRARASTGFQVKLSAQDGTAGILDITPKMINAQLVAEARVLGESPSRSASASTAPSGVSNGPVDPNAPGAKTASAMPEGAPHPPAGLTADRNIGLQMLPQSTGAMTHGSLHGAVILAVIPGSPAEAAGVRGGDLIVKLDGKLVESGKEILDLLAKAKPHSVVTVDILRGSAHVVARIKL